MKSTVDLTEDRLFPDIKSVRGPSWLLGDETYKEIVMLPVFNAILPWEFSDLSFISTDSQFNDWRFQISGSAKEYRQRVEWRKADSIEYCDRCGRRIRTPWRWDRSLCDDCSIQLRIEVENHKIPWDNNSNWATLNGRRIWIE